MLFTVARRVVAVYDTCVLFPNIQRDTLFRIHLAGLCRAHLTKDILDELERNLIPTGAVSSEEQVAHLMTQIREHLKEMILEGYEVHLSTLACDPKDRHVLAAAIQADAQIIVTDNVRHFPESALKPYNVVAQTADEFLCFMFDRDPDVMAQVLNKQSAAYYRVPLTVAQILEILHRHAKQFVASMYSYLWNSGDLPLDQHTLSLCSVLRRSNANIPRMDPVVEHELWARFGKEIEKQ